MNIKSAMLAIFLLCVSLVSFADNSIEPIEILEPPMSINDYEPGDDVPEILWMACNEEFLEINFLKTWLSGGDTNNLNITYLFDWSVLYSYNLFESAFSDPIVLRGQIDQEGYYSNSYWNQVHELVSDASSVTIGNKTIFLENAYMSRAVIDSGNPDSDQESLAKAYISPNHDYIIGITYYSSVYNDHYFGEKNTLHFWDAQTGLELSGMSHRVGLGYYELYFSPQEKYLIARFFSPIYHDFVNTGLGKDSHGFDTMIPGPNSILINLTQLNELSTKRDVAFTPDDKYFVTERDGVPTLVLAQTDGNLLRYSIPSPMISATFSPDGQRLYIAGANSKVYVYESGIDSFVREWELMK